MDWSDWLPLSSDTIEKLVPDQPGIYEIRANVSFGRVRGASPIIRIGSASQGKAPSLKQRLLQPITNPDRYSTPEERTLDKNGYKFEFRYACAPNRDQAQDWEAKRHREYFDEHWELPPANQGHPHRVAWP